MNVCVCVCVYYIYTHTHTHTHTQTHAHTHTHTHTHSHTDTHTPVLAFPTGVRGRRRARQQGRRRAAPHPSLMDTRKCGGQAALQTAEAPAPDTGKFLIN
jgi:hypothetical protein